MCDHLSSLPSGVKNVLAVLLAGFLFLGLNGCGTTVNQTNLDEAAINQTNVKGREEPTMKVQIPQSINAEHEELHRELEDAIKSGGTTGAAAREVADRLHTHFEKEEEYALPPLGLLKQLAEGKASAEMKETAKLSDAAGGLLLGSVVLGLLPIVHQPGGFERDLPPQFRVFHS